MSGMGRREIGVMYVVDNICDLCGKEIGPFDGQVTQEIKPFKFCFHGKCHGWLETYIMARFGPEQPYPEKQAKKVESLQKKYEMMRDEYERMKTLAACAIEGSKR